MNKYIIYCSAYDKAFAWKQGIHVKNSSWSVVNPTSTIISIALHNLKILGYLPHNCYSSYQECLLYIGGLHNPKLNTYHCFIIPYSKNEEEMIQKILQAEKDMEEIKLLKEII